VEDERGVHIFRNDSDSGDVLIDVGGAGQSLEEDDPANIAGNRHQDVALPNLAPAQERVCRWGDEHRLTKV
jgi:hypothetical protein